jgi:hypothetical protein
MSPLVSDLSGHFRTKIFSIFKSNTKKAPVWTLVIGSGPSIYCPAQHPRKKEDPNELFFLPEQSNYVQFIEAFSAKPAAIWLDDG